MHVVYPAHPMVAWYLKRTGFRAITLPWKTVHMLDDPHLNPGLLQHEAIHVEQIERLGAFRFTVFYLWYLLRHGYWDNPLEIEARDRSGHH